MLLGLRHLSGDTSAGRRIRGAEERASGVTLPNAGSIDLQLAALVAQLACGFDATATGVLGNETSGRPTAPCLTPADELGLVAPSHCRTGEAENESRSDNRAFEELHVLHVLFWLQILPPPPERKTGLREVEALNYTLFASMSR